MFCAHEYTLSNLAFAKTIEPNNPMIEQKMQMSQALRDQGEFTVGSRLMEERLYNPFIRCATEPYFKEVTGEHDDPVRRFAKVRKFKDNF